MGFLIVFLFLVVSHAQYWRLRIDGREIVTHTIHVWYIYLHLVGFDGFDGKSR